MHYSVEFGAKASVGTKYEHKIDKHWKVATQHAYDFNLVGSKHPYFKVGYDVTYSL